MTKEEGRGSFFFHVMLGRDAPWSQTDAHEATARLSELLACFRATRLPLYLDQMVETVRDRSAVRRQSKWQRLPSFVWEETARYACGKSMANAECASRDWQSLCRKRGLLPGHLCLDEFPPDILRRRVLLDLGRNSRAVDTLVSESKTVRGKLRDDLLERLVATTTLRAVRIAKMRIGGGGVPWPAQLVCLDLTLEQPEARTLAPLSHERLPNLESLRLVFLERGGHPCPEGCNRCRGLRARLGTVLGSHGGTLRCLALNTPLSEPLLREGLLRMTALRSVTLESGQGETTLGRQTPMRSLDFRGWHHALAGCADRLESLGFLGVFDAGYSEMTFALKCFPALRCLRSPLGLLASPPAPPLPDLSALESIVLDCGPLASADEILLRMSRLFGEARGLRGGAELRRVTLHRLPVAALRRGEMSELFPTLRFPRLDVLRIVPVAREVGWKQAADRALAPRFAPGKVRGEAVEWTATSPLVPVVP